MKRLHWFFSAAVGAGCVVTQAPESSTDDGTAADAAGAGDRTCTQDDECRKDSQCPGGACVDCACVAAEGDSTGSDGPAPGTGDDAPDSSGGDGATACSPSDNCDDDSDCGGGVCVDCICLGASCESDAECPSGKCFTLGVVGGVCSQCETDADCSEISGGGCSLPNPLPVDSVPALCNDGTLGDGCMSDAVCAEGLCAVIMDIPGLLTASACSECAEDADCEGGDVCVPQYDFTSIGGVRLCVAPGSVTDGGFCDLDGSGGLACATGHCAEAEIVTFFYDGICSECVADADCPIGTQCAPPEVTADGTIIAGECL
jgi:hypothetical protein